jgi:hypothetical protein
MKLVIRKEEKGFDVVEWFIDDTLGDKYLGCFPLGHGPLLHVIIDVHWFKKTTPKLYIGPFQISKMTRLKKWITQYNKLDTKIPIFAIPEDPNNPNHILPWHPKKWEDIQNNQFSIVGR